MRSSYRRVRTSLHTYPLRTNAQPMDYICELDDAHNYR